MINKRKNVWMPLLFSVVMVAGMFMGYQMHDAVPGKSFFYRQRTSPLAEIINLLDKKYVDSIDMKGLTDTAIQAILAKLDPHSVFIPASDLEDVNDDIKGSFFGIGIEFSIFNDSLHVINVLQGGPSDKAGLKTGDILLTAGDSAISGKKVSSERIRNILRGEAGSIVKLGILRAAKKQFVEVARGIIPINSVDASYVIAPSVGYIRLNKFSSKTYKEFMTALTELKKKNITSLVLDLRGNGGGVLEEAIEIADEFLEGDKLITYTEGLHSDKKEYRCRRQGQFEKGRLMILADEGSASASEVLMGALQDWDRATIIGRRSFGKGLVQEQYDLSDGSALRLTVARYFTPIGRSIQRSYKKGGAAYYEEISHRYADGEMTSADSVKNDTTIIYKSKAGKILFGGGGISPDYFIAADTAHAGIISSRIFARGILNDFGYKYFQTHRDELAAYKSSADFIARFSVTEKDWQYFEQLAKADSVSLTGISTKERSFITSVLKTAVARQLFRTEGYFEAANADDPFIKKALELSK